MRVARLLPLAALGLIAALALLVLSPSATVQSQSPTAPSAPKNLVVTPQNGALHVSWEAPDSEGGATLTGYSVQYRQSGETTWIDLSVDDGSGNTTTTIPASPVTITGLTPNQAYEVQVAAKNSAGTGAYASGTGTALSAPPGKPTDLTVTPGAVAALDVSWVAPSDTGSSAITGYSVQYRLVGTPTWVDLEVDDGTGTDTTTTTIPASPVTLSNLVVNQPYQVRVAAKNSEATSAYADAVTATPSATPPPPTQLPGPVPVSAVADGASLTLTFSGTLDTTSTPAASAFTVTVGGNTVSLAAGSNAVRISNDGGAGIVTLTLASALTGGEAVTVAYSKPATNPLQDDTSTNNEVASFAAITAHNVTGAPRVLSALVTAGGTKITISFSETLDATSVPAASAFTLIWNREEVTRSDGSSLITGLNVSLDATTPVEISGSTVTLNFGLRPNGQQWNVRDERASFHVGMPVTVSYAPPGAGKLQSAGSPPVAAEPFMQLALNYPNNPHYINFSRGMFQEIVVSSGVRGLTLDWEAPPDGASQINDDDEIISLDEGTRISRYEIRAVPFNDYTAAYAQATPSIWTTKTYTVGTTTGGDYDSGPYTDTITGLTPGVVYRVQMRSVNVVGASTWSSSRRGLPIAAANAPTVGIYFRGSTLDGYMSARDLDTTTNSPTEVATALAANIDASGRTFKFARLTTDPGASCPSADTEYGVQLSSHHVFGDEGTLRRSDFQWTDGQVWLCARVSNGTDTAVSKPVTFIVDTTAPTITVTNPDQSAGATSRTFTASSTTGASDQIAWRLDDATCDAVSPDGFAGLTDGASATVTGTGNNNKHVCFYAIDAAGNTGAGGDLVSAVSARITGLTDQTLATATKVVSVTADKSEVNENGADAAARTVTFTVTLDAPAASDLTLEYVIRGIANGQGHNVYTDDDPAQDHGLTDAQLLALDLNYEGIHKTDFVRPTVFKGSSATFTISSGQSSGTFEVEIRDDDDYEVDEVFRFRAKAGSSGLNVANTNANRADVTIKSEDAAPTQPEIPTQPPGPPSGPAAVSASIDGAGLEIIFHLPLDTTKVPAGSAFTVSVDPDGDETGQSPATVTLAGTNPVDVRNITVDDVSYGTVLLTLATALTGGETVTVSYAAPQSGDKLQDDASTPNVVADFTDLAVANYTGAPTFLDGAVAADGLSILLNFSEPLNSARVPAASAFTVEVDPDGNGPQDAADAALAATNPVAISGCCGVTLTLSLPILSVATVTVAYDKPSGDTSLRGGGEDVQSFDAQSVTNGSTVQPASNDYDADDDQLIEVANLAQLNAIRWDLNGDGAADDSANNAAYAAAFPNAAADMGCRDDTCTGYELTADLDFDEDGDGVKNDTYNTGDGWTPIGLYDGGNSEPFAATFEGNGHTISNLFINQGSASDRDRGWGLFGFFNSTGKVNRLGLVDVDITGQDHVGALAGRTHGAVFAVYSTGSVTGTGGGFVGGLVGYAQGGSITASYSRASATGHYYLGGLVGRLERASITAGYATGAVHTTSGSGNRHRGGLVGRLEGATTVTASYSTGAVTPTAAGTGNFGGLVGDRDGSQTATNSYWDTDKSGLDSSDAGEGYTTSQLRTPTGYTGIYADWNVNVDGVSGADDPWDFRGNRDYPALSVDFDGDGTAIWQEFGIQRTPSLVQDLQLTPGSLRIEVSWRAPADAVALGLAAYSVQYRETSASDWIDLSVSGSTAISASPVTITGLTSGTAYRVRVAGTNSLGTGLYTARSATPNALPSVPLNLVLTAGDGQIEAAWDAPSSPGNPALDGYYVQFRVGTSGSWTNLSECPQGQDCSLGQNLVRKVIAANARTATITLANNIAYQVRVQAKNSDGEGPWTAPKSATPKGVAAANSLPTANAGLDQTVNAGTLVTLDGSLSIDPDGDDLTYTWTRTSGPSVTLDLTDPARPTFRPPSAGQYVFSLVVNDGTTDSNTDTVRITVVATGPNARPVARAGPDQTVNPGASVTLDGSGSSDSDAGDTITYAWTQTSGPTVTLSSVTAQQPTFTPTAAGAYVFRLVVNDGRENSAADSVRITVRNLAPVFAFPDGQTSYTFELAENQDGSSTAVAVGMVSATDANGDTLTYTITAGNTGGKFAISSDGAITYTGSGEEYDDFTTPTAAFRLTVRVSAGGQSATAIVTIAVTEVTVPDKLDPPVVAVTSGSNTSITAYWTTVPDAVSYTVQHREGTSGNWSSGTTRTGTPPAALAEISGLTAGTLYQVRVRAANASGAGDWSEPGQGRTASTTNAAPTISTDATQSIEENSTTLLVLGASDSDSADGIKSYGPLLGPDADLFNNPRIVVGTAGGFEFKEPPDFETPLGGLDDNSNNYVVIVFATFGSGDRALTTAKQITYAISDVNEAPKADAGPNQRPRTSATVTLDGSDSSDPDAGDTPATLTYAWEQIEGPTVMLSSVTAVRPTFTAPASPATLVFRLTVTDDGTPQALFDTDTVTITVVTPGPNRNTPAFTNTPYNFTLAENDDGRSTAIALGTVSATDGDDDPLTFSITRGNTNNKFAIDPGSGVITYTGSGEDYESFRNPAAAYSLTVQADDGRGRTRTATVTIAVTDENEAPSFAESTYTFELVENENGSTTAITLGSVSATDPEGDTLTYSITAGNTGNKFAIDRISGVITYTGGGEDYESFATPAAATSAFSLTVEASDARAIATATATVTIAVTDVDDQPGRPDKPFLAVNSGTPTTKLDVYWNPVPDATSYDIRYRQSGTSAWTNGPQDQTGTRATIDGLTAGTLYQVQVRATNDGGDSGWSATRSGRTAPTSGNGPPVFGAITGNTVAENTGRNDTDIRITASDPDCVSETQCPDDFDNAQIAHAGAEADRFTVGWHLGGYIAVLFNTPPDFEAAQSHTVTVFVTIPGSGDRALTTAKDFTITVTDVNDAPAVNAGPDREVETGATVTLSGTATDDDGDTLTYQWREILEEGAESAVDLTDVDLTATSFSFTAPDSPATLTFELKATEDGGTPLSGTDTVTITVVAPPPPTPTTPTGGGGGGGGGARDRTPTFDTDEVEDQVLTTGGDGITLQLPVASGGDGDLTYSISPPLPAGLSFDPATRTITGTPEAALEPTTFTFTATDRDGDTITLSFTLTVEAPEPPPVEVETDPDGAATFAVSGAGTAPVTLTIGEETVEVEVSADEASLGALLTLTAEAAPAGLAAITFTATTSEDVLTAPLPGFRIPGSQTVIDVALRDAEGNAIRELAEPVTVCLPVSAELIEEADERELALLHYDAEEGWTALPGSMLVERNDGGSLLCAPTSALSPFAAAYRLSTDSSLRLLALGDVELTPAFAPEVTAYTAAVAHDVASVVLTQAQATQRAATVAVTPADADARRAGHQVALQPGDNVIAVTVTAEDGLATTTYTVTVTRAPAPEDETVSEDETAEVAVSAEVAVWRLVADPTRLFVSVRAEGDRWSTRDAALEMSAEHSPSGRFERSEIVRLEARLGDVRVPVEVAVWRLVADPTRLFVSVRAEGGRWNTRDTALEMSAEHSPSGRFERSEIVRLEASPAAAPAPRVGYHGGFTEAEANDGAVTGAIVATLRGATFSAGVVSDGGVSTTNVPAGLRAVFTRTSDTVVTLTLSGRADAHADVDDVDALTVRFSAEAFTTATVVGNAEYARGTIDFADPAPAASPRPATYTVRAGDTFNDIALRFGVPPGQLAAANGIADTSLIVPGQVLTIPPPPEATYTVVAGDTLAGIANRLGVNVDDLAAVNGIADPTRIYPGQVLTVPGE